MREGAELADVVRTVHSATARLVELIGYVIAAEAWRCRRIHSAEQWVARECGVAPARARRLVAIARRLPELPETAAAFLAGELSEDQVALLCAHECADAEGLTLARGRTVAELRRALADWRPRGETPAPRRRVSFGHDHESGTSEMSGV